MSGFWVNRPKGPRLAVEYFWARRRRREHRCVDSTGSQTSITLLTRDELIHRFHQIKKDGGHGAGLDRLTFDLLNPANVGELLGDLAARIQSGEYLPHATRPQSIPKGNAGDYRLLQIPVLLDRVVQKALAALLEPYWERRFLPSSWGWRPGRNTWGMLCAIEKALQTTGWTVLAVDDVRTAFDTAPIGKIVECHAELLRELRAVDLPQNLRREAEQHHDRLNGLIDTVLRGDRKERQRGIDQGSCFSPLSMNALFHVWLDLPLRVKIKDLLGHRFGDNLCYVCPSMHEGREVLAEIANCLTPLGMSLKGPDRVINLREGDKTPLLGFTLTWRDGEMVYGPGQGSIDHLSQALDEAHKSEDPPRTARKAIDGWILSCGPAFETGNAVIPLILDIAATYGFREMTSPEAIQQRCQDAWNNWLKFRHRHVR
ncbi:MAG: reverse transcriptase domain-containing protein [Gemmataceae bacterium]